MRMDETNRPIKSWAKTTDQYAKKGPIEIVTSTVLQSPSSIQVKIESGETKSDHQSWSANRIVSTKKSGILKHDLLMQCK